MYCAPGSRDKVSCYTKSQLLEIARRYNSRYGDSIIQLNGTKDELWQDINNRMSGKCKTETCWATTFDYDAGLASFRPLRPPGVTPWLSTGDIKAVLSQYTSVYQDFLPIGPLPIDFCGIGDIVCDMDVLRAYRKGTRTIGVVFNTDPSHLPGKHWVALFIDMRPANRNSWEINYFDSFGNANMAPEIMRLIKHITKSLASAGIRITPKLNCSDSVCTNNVKHQRNSTECGVYCIHFIVKRLEGTSWESLVTSMSRELNDERMIALRNFYFRSP
jgi:hypothetical protein